MSDEPMWPNSWDKRALRAETRAAECDVYENALRGILRLPEAEQHLDALRRGIGIATPSGQAWATAFVAIGALKLK